LSEEIAEKGKFGCFLVFHIEVTPGTDLARRCYMHNQTQTIRVRVVVILSDLAIIIDIEIP